MGYKFSLHVECPTVVFIEEFKLFVETRLGTMSDPMFAKAIDAIEGEYAWYEIYEAKEVTGCTSAVLNIYYRVDSLQKKMVENERQIATVAMQGNGIVTFDCWEELAFTKRKIVQWVNKNFRVSNASPFRSESGIEFAPKPDLTGRERDVVQMLLSGIGYAEMARMWGIAASSARSCARDISIKWGLGGTTNQKTLREEAIKRGYGNVGE